MSSTKERRLVKAITIDGLTSKDLDDAIFASRCGDRILVSIHIADVTHFVTPGSSIDLLARERVATIYLNEGNIPMLPRDLAEDKLSLLPGKKRYTVSLNIILDHHAEVVSYNFEETILISQKRFTYEMVDCILERERDSEWFNLLALMKRIAQRLNQNRMRKGAIGFTHRNGFFFDEEGKILLEGFSRSQQIIAEFMILANTVAANHLRRASYPALFRNHSTRDLPDDKQILMPMIKDIASAEELRKFLGNCLGRARYAPISTGHFALNLPNYLHWTSPIRRYADVVVHWGLKGLINDTQPPYNQEELAAIAQQMNEVIEQRDTERRAYIETQEKKKTMRRIMKENFTDLEPKDFSRVIKMAVINSKLLEIEEEVIRRAKLYLLTQEDFYHILIEGERQKDLETEVLGYLSPETAKSVLNVSTQKKPNWNDIQITAEQDSKNVFIVNLSVRCDGNVVTSKIRPMASDISKKMAVNLAAKEWIRSYIDENLEIVPECPPVVIDEPPVMITEPINIQPISPTTTPSISPDKEISDEEDRDYVSDLNIFAQMGGYSLPEYSYKYDLGNFICTCQFLEVTSTGVGKSKKEAKKLAAKNVRSAVAS